MPATSSVELDAEAAHLADARAGLARMRARADSLKAAGGNAVSTEYLAAALHRRRMSLVDDPSTPLFFGRIDLGQPGAHERFYIGRRHVQDERGDPMVIDWRADVSTAFYRASASDPMNLRLRRRFGFAGGMLTAYEDETFDATSGIDDLETSRILTEEIERPRVGPMRDIVATIQPDQDEIVRADLEQTLCVQGGPGTGKTAVGLHRAAYLLYAYRAKLRSGGVLVVGPNAAFLRYIEQVLPALGEVEVTQVTIDELVAHGKVRAVDPPNLQRLKGDVRMAELLRRAVWEPVGGIAEPIVIPRGATRLRLYPSHVDQLKDALVARGLRYNAARSAFATMLGSAFTAQVEVRGEAADDRTVAAFARSKQVRACVDAVLPALKPLNVLFRLYTEPAFLAAAANGVLTPEEQEMLRWSQIPRTVAGARWTSSDLVLIDELNDLLDRTPSFGHVVLDEAQDLSPMQCRAVGRRCSTGSATVLGDLAQGTSATASDSWQETLSHMGKSDGHVRVLERGYRVPRQVVEFAARLLPVAAPGVAAPLSIRASAGSLRVVETTSGELERVLGVACEESLEFPGSVGLVAADDHLARIAGALRKRGLPHVILGADDDARLTLVPASMAKGLEFDHVVLVEPSDIALADEIDPRFGLRRLYIALTRAVSGLVVVHSKPLPEALAA
ncbi:MAG TPA: AAA family ATPase [Acidothermaceae bacterium]